jgi:hypothetical protein
MTGNVTETVLTHHFWPELYKKSKIIEIGSIMKMEFEF